MGSLQSAASLPNPTRRNFKSFNLNQVFFRNDGFLFMRHIGLTCLRSSAGLNLNHNLKSLKANQ